MVSVDGSTQRAQFGVESRTRAMLNSQTTAAEPMVSSPKMCAAVSTPEAANPAGERAGSPGVWRKQPAKIDMTVMTSLAEARYFAAEWAEFAEAEGGGNPFLHPDWLMPWAERFLRRNDQVRLMAARLNDQLVGVAPFYRRSLGLGLAHSMQLWGTGRHSGLTELPGLLVERRQQRNVTRVLVRQLCTEAKRWDWAFLPLQDPLWFEPAWLPKGGSITVLAGTVRASVVRPICEPGLGSMKRNVRESIRRAHNRLDRAYPGRWSVERATGHNDLTQAFWDLSRLHRARSGIAGKEVHRNVLRRGADSAFLLETLTQSAPRAGACIYRLVADDRALAALLVLRTTECSYFLLSGMSEDAWEYSPVTLLQGYAIDDAAKLGHRQLDLSVGPNTAKLRWSEQILVHPEFVLVANRPASLATFSAYWLASAAAAIKRERNRHSLLRHAARNRQELNAYSARKRLLPSDSRRDGRACATAR
jgi:CelD/BcsL family acetyltransferase involved in cellulose biosynthesis